MSNIIDRLKNDLHTRACATSERAHLDLYHKHFACIFPKGTTRVLSRGKNYKSCILRRFEEGEREDRSRRKVGRLKGSRLSYDTRGSRLYQQLPIKSTDKPLRPKLVYTCRSSSSHHRRTKIVQTMRSM